VASIFFVLFTFYRLSSLLSTRSIIDFTIDGASMTARWAAVTAFGGAINAAKKVEGYENRFHLLGKCGSF